MIGGSTTDEGPKNDGISPDVVTGVFRSPVCWCCTLRSAVCCCVSWIFNVGWLWWPLDDVVVVDVDEDTLVESDFDWVTEVAECELVLLLFDVFTTFACCCWCCWLCWIVDCCICCWCWWCCCCCCWWWWLLNNCVCWCEWWLLLAVAWLLLFKLYELAVVAAVLNKLHVSKLSTLKCAAAADSVNR